MSHGDGEGPPPALFAFFERMPRQGPGAPEVTRALFDELRAELPAVARVADMGCGSGAAGLVLAEAGAEVIGVDVHRPFLASFERRAAERGVADRVRTRCADLAASGLAPGSLDLVWSEGAVFTVGFERALAAFALLVTPGGFVVVSENVWLQEAVPAAARDFWAEGYPEMRTVGGALRAAEGLGYRFRAARLLPRWAWERDFYTPMAEVIAEIEAEGPEELRAVAREHREEIALFRRHGDVFGYVFFVLARPGPIV